jgi:hypothetical protein
MITEILNRERNTAVNQIEGRIRLLKHKREMIMELSSLSDYYLKSGYPMDAKKYLEIYKDVFLNTIAEIEYQDGIISLSSVRSELAEKSEEPVPVRRSGTRENSSRFTILK